MQRNWKLASIKRKLATACGLTMAVTVAVYTCWLPTENVRTVPEDKNIPTNVRTGANEQVGANARTESIPKILHHVFKSEMVYDNYKPFIEACLMLNPGWKYYLWRDSDAEDLIADFLPYFASQYKKFKGELQRSDSIRYIVLYLYGGIYLDIDVECVKPFFPALASEFAFLDQERLEQANILWNRPYSAINSVMGSRPGHPFFRDVIHALMNVNQTLDAIHSTGPDVLTNMYEQYSKSLVALPPVQLLDPKVMSPIMDGRIDWRMRCKVAGNAHKKPDAARSWRERGCVILRSKNWRLDDTDSRDTLAIHRFIHLGYNSNNKRRGKLFNMTAVFGSRVSFYSEERDAGLLPSLQ